MPISVEERRTALETILEQPSANLSLAMRFGLGAGLYFEYFRRPDQTPSHFIVSLNRNLDRNLAVRIEMYANGDPRAAVHDALQENALLFNLDRAPTTALMGMEMLAEQLADFARISNWRASIQEIGAEITTTGSCYRRIYMAFLREIQPLFDTVGVCEELSEIADEWDKLAQQLTMALDDPTQLERASQLLRRLAFREEHFWGNVLDL